MTSHAHPLAFTRAVAIAALLSATMLATPLIAARADTAAPPAATPMAQPKSPAAAKMHTESLEQRIASLHRSLKITADETPKWNDVAQAMRENAAALQKLDAQRTLQAPQDMTAVQDLNGYRAFAQAHVDGLKI